MFIDECIVSRTSSIIVTFVIDGYISRQPPPTSMPTAALRVLWHHSKPINDHAKHSPH